MRSIFPLGICLAVACIVAAFLLVGTSMVLAADLLAPDEQCEMPVWSGNDNSAALETTDVLVADFDIYYIGGAGIPLPPLPVPIPLILDPDLPPLDPAPELPRPGEVDPDWPGEMVVIYVPPGLIEELEEFGWEEPEWAEIERPCPPEAYLPVLEDPEYILEIYSWPDFIAWPDSID